MAKRVTQNEKSFDNNVVKKNQRTTIAWENGKLRPDLMMNNLVIYTTTIWWSTPASGRIYRTGTDQGKHGRKYLH
jgi:hypothetical protein